VMVGDEDVGDAVDAVVGQPVEDVAAPEIDEDRLSFPAKQVHVHAIGVAEDVGLDLHEIAV
jgi:hypothetical protein